MFLFYNHIVSVFPPEFFVSTPGGSAEFKCILLGGNTLNRVQWYVNESLLETLDLRNVSTTISAIVGVGILNFNNLPIEYNMTRIRCVVSYTSSSNRMKISPSPNSTLLLLQG